MIWFDLICIGHNLLYQRKWQPIDKPLLILYNLYMNKWLLHLKYPQKKKMKLSNKPYSLLHELEHRMSYWQLATPHDLNCHS